jgi:hypothetical protein
LLLQGPPLSPGVVRGVGTTSRDPLPRAPLSVGASAAEWEILDRKRVDLRGGAPGPAGPGSGPCRARLGPVPGPARAPCRARLAPPGPKRPNQQVEERGGPGEEKTGPAKARSAARERPLLTRPGTGPARARPTYVRGPSIPAASYCLKTIKKRRGTRRAGHSRLGAHGRPHELTAHVRSYVLRSQDITPAVDTTHKPQEKEPPRELAGT